MKNTTIKFVEGPWWKDGIRFECQGSGKCCVSRGEYGFVYVSLQDRRRFAKHLKISTLAFTKKYCQKTDGHFHLKESPKQNACIFLQNSKCGVYKARPTQCRTWPFWPENMSAKKWTSEVKKFCPGVGKGEIVSAEKIKKQLLLQFNSE